MTPSPKEGTASGIEPGPDEIRRAMASGTLVQALTPGPDPALRLARYLDDLETRVYAVERRLIEIEKALSALVGSNASPPTQA